MPAYGVPAVVAFFAAFVTAPATPLTAELTPSTTFFTGLAPGDDEVPPALGPEVEFFPPVITIGPLTNGVVVLGSDGSEGSEGSDGVVSKSPGDDTSVWAF